MLDAAEPAQQLWSSSVQVSVVVEIETVGDLEAAHRATDFGDGYGPVQLDDR